MSYPPQPNPGPYLPPFQPPAQMHFQPTAEKKHHAWGVIIPLWIVASPIALFLAYILIRVGYAFFHGLIFGN